MKKIFLLLLVVFGLILIGCGDNPIDEEKEPIDLVVNDGTNVAKILLAQERLNEDVLKNSNSIFNAGQKAFNTILTKTRGYSKKFAGRPNETYTEVDGDTYKWYNDVDYSNFLSFFESYAINIEASAENGARLIDYTKKHIRVVNNWVKEGNNEYYLIVTEDSEIIINRESKIFVNICKRYTNGTGSNVYEMITINRDTKIRMTYIPNLVYEFVIQPISKEGLGHYLLADNHKGYWQIISTNGINSNEIEGEVVENFNITSLVMKEEANYLLNYLIDSTGYSNIGDIQIVSSDGKSDLLSLSQNYFELFNTGIRGLDHLEITAPSDKVGDFDPNSNEKLYVYKQDNINEKGEHYYIYSTSGYKSATAVCENGITFTEGDVLLDGKVRVNRIDVSYVAGCDSYGRIPVMTTANSLEEQYQILKEFLEYTGLTFRRNYDDVINCLDYAIKDAKNFANFYTLNGYHLNNVKDLKVALAIEDSKFDDLINLYEQLKDLEVIDIEDQEKYNENIHFSNIEKVNEGEITNQGFKVVINDYQVKVLDTLLFVEDEEYVLEFGLLSEDNNIISFRSLDDSVFKYQKESDFELSLSKEFEIGLLDYGKYTLVVYVALASENIRTTNYIKVEAFVTSDTYTINGHKMTIKQNELGNLEIISEKDYNIYYESNEQFTYVDLESFIGQIAYDNGMIENLVIEFFDGKNWIILENESKEATYLEKGEYRMMYIPNIDTSDVEIKYYVYVTLN